MNTAKARQLALDAANVCDWGTAARLLALAIANYPTMPGRNGLTPLQQLDISKMKTRLASYEAAAKEL